MSLDIQDYLDEMKEIHAKLLIYLDNENDIEENFQNLHEIFTDLKINDNQYKLKSLLHLISRISTNHFRSVNFFTKIERILQNFEVEIKKFYTNLQIFNIFKSNKRILSFLWDEQIIIFDNCITKKFFNIDKFKELKYPQYFSPEIYQFKNEKWFKNNLIIQKLPDNFYEKRKIGENDSIVCNLIQKDLLKEFIIFVNRNDLSIDDSIETSIFETNSFLLKKGQPSLIEYAAFFGSIQIFNYLKINGAEMTSALWDYAIHGQNAEIIHLLEENQEIEFPNLNSLFTKSIKCHHNDIAYYFVYNYNYIENSQNTINQSLKYYNFAFLQNDYINEYSFSNLCKYDYYILVDILFKETDINANKQRKKYEIQYKIFQ